MITRSKMRRQLYRGGGIAGLYPRQKYGIGSWVQEQKDKIVDRTRKLIPNELADVAVKAAPFVAPFNPGIAGLMRGIGRLDQRGSLTDALKQGLATTAFGAGTRYLGGASPMGGGLTGGFTSPIQQGGPIANTWAKFTGGADKAVAEKAGASWPGGRETLLTDTTPSDQTWLNKVLYGKEKGTGFFGDKGLIGAGGDFDMKGAIGKGLPAVYAGSTLAALAVQKAMGDVGERETGESLEAFNKRRKGTVSQYLDFYFRRANKFRIAPENMDAAAAKFVADNTKEYVSHGGRVGLQAGGISMGNTLAQIIAANRAQANQVQQMLQATRAKLPGAAQAPSGITTVPTAQAQTMVAPTAAPQTMAALQTMAAPPPPGGIIPPVAMTGEIGEPGEMPPWRSAGMAEQDFWNLPEADRQNLVETETAKQEAQMEADEKKYGSYYSPDGRDATVDPRVGKQAYMDIKQAILMNHPEEYAKLTGNETLAELDKLSGQFAGYWSQGGRVGLRFGTPEAGIKSLDAGAPDITYEGNEGPQAPQEEQQMADAMLKEEYDKYVFDLLEIRPEATPMSFEEFKMMVIAEGKMSGGQPLPEDPTKPINPFAPKPTGPVLPDKMMAAQGGRIGQLGGTGPAGLPGIPRMAPDGMEYDMRMNGGFQGLGAKEGKDDVPAMLAKNEFVFTADAVRGAGGGDIELGAQRMYDTMKNLEKRVV